MNGITSEFANSSPACGAWMPQYDWQSADQVGRETIAYAIRMAETNIAQALGYPVAPDWVTDEEVMYDRPANRGLWHGSFSNLRWGNRSLQTRMGYVLSGGIRASTLIGANRAITWTDEDGDTYKETGTVTAATTVTDANEIALFFPNEGGNEDWEIRPLKSVTFVGANVVITFRRELAVLPDLNERINWDEVNGDVDGNFLTVADVYRVYNDPQTQATLLWEPGGSCGCSGSGCPSCVFDSHTGCLYVRDRRLGIVVVQPATWDAEDAEFDATYPNVSRMADKALLYYRTGHRGKTVRPMVDMDNQFAQWVSWLACSYLDRPICGCDTIRAYVEKWKEDLSGRINREGIAEEYKLTDAMLSNPLGTSRAGVTVWNALNMADLRIGR